MTERSTNHYRALSGRTHDLSSLTDAELEFIEEVFALFRQRPTWDAFGRQWLEIGRRRLWTKAVPVGSTAYRICQDLATRLGVAEGKVASPDYRDLLADLIEDRFGSRYAFCKQTGIDQGHLSRVLAGTSHLAPTTWFQALEALGVRVDLVDARDLCQPAHDPFLPQSPADRLHNLARRIADLRSLATQLDAVTSEGAREELVRRSHLFDASTTPPGRAAQEAVRQALDEAYADQAELGRQVTADALEARGKAAG